jgi:hypothetical protein
MVYGPLTWKLCCASHASGTEVSGYEKEIGPAARSASTVHVPAAMKVTLRSAAIVHADVAVESM